MAVTGQLKNERGATLTKSDAQKKMVKQVLFFNGKEVSNFDKVTLTLKVDVSMIQTVIDKSKQSWEIKKLGQSFLSNKNRDSAIISITLCAFAIQDVMDILGIGHIENTNIEYFRTNMCVERVRTCYSFSRKPKAIAFNLATKTYTLLTDFPAGLKNDKYSKMISENVGITSKNIFKKI